MNANLSALVSFIVLIIEGKKHDHHRHHPNHHHYHHHHYHHHNDHHHPNYHDHHHQTPAAWFLEILPPARRVTRWEHSESMVKIFYVVCLCLWLCHCFWHCLCVFHCLSHQMRTLRIHGEYLLAWLWYELLLNIMILFFYSLLIHQHIILVSRYKEYYQKFCDCSIPFKWSRNTASWDQNYPTYPISTRCPKKPSGKAKDLTNPSAHFVRDAAYVFAHALHNIWEKVNILNLNVISENGRQPYATLWI